MLQCRKDECANTLRIYHINLREWQKWKRSHKENNGKKKKLLMKKIGKKEIDNNRKEL